MIKIIGSYLVGHGRPPTGCPYQQHQRRANRMWMAIALANLIAAGIGVHYGYDGIALVNFGAFLACLKEDP